MDSFTEQDILLTAASPTLLTKNLNIFRRKIDQGTIYEQRDQQLMETAIQQHANAETASTTLIHGIFINVMQKSI